MTTSLALRISPPIPERASPTSAFFTYCWVIVDPPCRSPPNRLFFMARMKPVNENPGLRVEVAVLGGHHRVTQLHRYLVDVDIDAVAFRRNDFRHLAAVAGQDRRHLVGPDVAGLGHVDDHVRHREGDDRQHDHRGDRYDESAPDPLPVDLRACAGLPARRAGRWSTTAGRATRGRGRRRRLFRRRCAVECRLHSVDGIAPLRWRAVAHRREDRRAPVVGRQAACPRRQGRRFRLRAVPSCAVGVLGSRVAHTISHAPRTDVVG